MFMFFLYDFNLLFMTFFTVSIIILARGGIYNCLVLKNRVRCVTQVIVRTPRVLVNNETRTNFRIRFAYEIRTPLFITSHEGYASNPLLPPAEEPLAHSRWQRRYGGLGFKVLLTTHISTYFPRVQGLHLNLYVFTRQRPRSIYETTQWS